MGGGNVFKIFDLREMLVVMFRKEGFLHTNRHTLNRLPFSTSEGRGSRTGRKKEIGTKTGRRTSLTRGTAASGGGKEGELGERDDGGTKLGCCPKKAKKPRTGFCCILQIEGKYLQMGV